MSASLSLFLKPIPDHLVLLQYKSSCYSAFLRAGLDFSFLRHAKSDTTILLLARFQNIVSILSFPNLCSWGLCLFENSNTFTVTFKRNRALCLYLICHLYLESCFYLGSYFLHFSSIISFIPLPTLPACLSTPSLFLSLTFFFIQSRIYAILLQAFPSISSLIVLFLCLPS